MTLYFVRADNDDGENLDLFVRANDAYEAEAMWAAYYDQCGLTHAPLPQYAAPIPDSPAHGAIPWSEIQPEKTYYDSRSGKPVRRK